MVVSGSGFDGKMHLFYFKVNHMKENATQHQKNVGKKFKKFKNINSTRFRH